MDNSDKKIWRIVDLLEWSKAYLHKKNIESPQIEAELMLRDILNLSRLDIYLNHNQIVNQQERTQLKNYLKKRVSGIPIQYIIGYSEFMGYKIFVSPDTLIPRQDTEVIVEQIYDRYDQDQELKILDLCTGSGCIAAALAGEFPKAHITALDVSRPALKIAYTNFKNLKIDNRIKILHQDLLINQTIDQKFDIIISNPPYISGKMYDNLDPLVKDNEPHIALNPGADELIFYKIIAGMTPNNLTTNGELYVEIGGDYQEEKITKIFIEKGLKNLEIIKDYNGISRGIKATR